MFSSLTDAQAGQGNGGLPAAQTSPTSPGNSFSPTVAETLSPNSGSQDVPSPTAVLIGMIALLLLLKFVSEHEKTSIKPAALSIGGYNLLAVTVTSIVGIALMKLLFIRVKVPGITPLVEFV